jgi:hypothetical protein
MRHPVTALALMLAGSSLLASTPLPELPPAALKTLTLQEANRANQALAYLNATVLPTLGLSADDTFALRHSLTNPQGECVARFDQYYQGELVQDTSVVIKVAPDGTCSVSAQKVAPHIDRSAPTARLTPSQGLEVVTARLAPTVGYARTPVVRPVITAAASVGELRMAKNPATGLLAMDPLSSADLFTPVSDYVRAYEVFCELESSDRTKPNVKIRVLLDATSGSILDRNIEGPKVENPFLYATGQAFNPRLAVSPSTILQAAAQKTVKERAVMASSQAVAATSTQWLGSPSQLLTPALGTGRTFYMGTTLLPTTYDASPIDPLTGLPDPTRKGYGLLDTTRGGANNYLVQDRMGYYDSYYAWHQNHLRPAGNTVFSSALELNYYVPYTMDAVTGSLFQMFANDRVTPVPLDLRSGRPATTGDITKDNVWGNGRDLDLVTDPDMPAYGSGVFSVTGQTAAAEAMNTMTCTYEFLKYAFNRTGLDNKDTAMNVVVNSSAANPGEAYGYRGEWYNEDNGNRAWHNYFLVTTGLSAQAYGILNAAEPTLMGRVFGTMLWETILGYPRWNPNSTAPANLQGFGNLMSQGIYSLGSLHGMNRRAVQPNWVIGQNYVGGGVAMVMFQPSLDGLSSDYRYDGYSMIGLGDRDIQSGPVNRAYYFMAEGASASTSAYDYTSFLPNGMTGIGLEKTCKIAYKALTERLASADSDLHTMKAALVQAAGDLYGAGSPEVIATTNAWAGINVGAAYGQAEPIQVWIDAQNFHPDGPLGANAGDSNPRTNRSLLMPLGESTQLTAHVIGTTDTSLTWTNNDVPYVLGTFPTMTLGHMTEGGIFTPPLRPGNGSIDWWLVQTASKVDPRQKALGIVMSFAMDFDGDGGNDALDFGYLALSFDIERGIMFTINDSMWPGWGFPMGEDNLVMNLAAFKTAFGN